MRIKFFYIMFLLIFFTTKVCSKDLIFKCHEEELCEFFKIKVEEIVKNNHDDEMLKNHLKQLLSFDEVKSLRFEIQDDKITITLGLKNKIERVDFEIDANTKVDEEIIENLKLLTVIHEGKFIEDLQIEEEITKIKKYCEERGIRDPDVSITPLLINGIGTVKIKINLKQIVTVEDVKVDSENNFLENYFTRKASKIRYELLNIPKIKEMSEEFRRDLYRKGFYYGIINFDIVDTKDANQKLVKFKVIPGPILRFGVRYNFNVSKKEILDTIKKSINSDTNNLEINFLKSLIEKLYKERGFYQVKIKSYELPVNSRSETGKTYYFEINEGERTEITSVSFKGVSDKTKDEISEVFWDNATTLLSRGYYEEKPIQGFNDIILKKFYTEGKILAKVSGPYIVFSDDQKQVSVEYRISEGTICKVDEINILGIPPEFTDEISELLKNKVGKELNITAIDEDRDNILSFLHEKGYYFAKSVKQNPKEMITYKNDYREANIEYVFDTSSITKLLRYEISGNIKTKNVTIERELHLKKNDLITPNDVKEMRDRLLSLGIFSSVELSVDTFNQGGENLSNIIIKVKERDFGIIEVAPGYRTDLGLKLSTKISYNNLFGKNRIATFEAQTNKRLDESTIDPDRRGLNRKELEYLFKFNYLEPYLFNYPLSWSFTTSTTRKTFYTFDAEITKLGQGVSKNLGKNAGVGLSYQYETIEQFDALDEKDNDNFTIGSITPSIDFDYRDNPINPTRGWRSSLSAEYATPMLLSQNKEDLEINFIKLIQRSYLYLPLNYFTVAVSLALGHQRNLEKSIRTDSSGNILYNDDGNQTTRGRIPSIKLFRLNGPDTVRGYDDGEINKMDSGEDISELYIQDTVNFVGLKIEPRFSINDNVLMAPFFDAGRLYVSSFRPLDLKMSVGLSFKILTPVGSIDFDYGLKLRRQRYSNGERESPGNFHVSIGFF